ncbi:MAG: hypothetical protein FJY65_09180 [Calditrichaeota bacterium]|nr:hypothetical protein [Calditrichota bacterium]
MHSNKHDLIVAYQQEYDDTLHRTTPFSTEAVAAVERHIAAFDRLLETAGKYWSGKRWGAVFLPDHGARLDAATGKGEHSLDIPEDMEIKHFWRFSFPSTT